MANVPYIDRADNKTAFFYIKSWNICTYFVYFKTKKEYNNIRSEYTQLLIRIKKNRITFYFPCLDLYESIEFRSYLGWGPRAVVSTAAFHASVRGSFPGLGGLKETKMFLPHPRVKVSIVGSLRDREVACSASDRQGLNFEFCVWRAVSSHSSHHPQEVLLAQFSLYVHKSGLKPDSFHFLLLDIIARWNFRVNQRTMNMLTRDIQPMLVQCWSTVCNNCPALYHHMMTMSCCNTRIQHVFQPLLWAYT